MKDTDISSKVRKEVLKRDSIDGCPCCIVCGKPFLNGGAHLHHVVPRSQGGKGERANLVTLCFNCHEELHNGSEDVKWLVREYLNYKEK